MVSMVGIVRPRAGRSLLRFVASPNCLISDLLPVFPLLSDNYYGQNEVTVCTMSGDVNVAAAIITLSHIYTMKIALLLYVAIRCTRVLPE